LNRALALVRPVSMTDETASDWLAAAVAETTDLSDDAFRAGVANARKTCTYHGQIIPTIVADASDRGKPDPFAWALACHAPTMPAMHLDGPTGGARMLGDVLKGIEYEG
jgi:hypothetical protein